MSDTFFFHANAGDSTALSGVGYDLGVKFKTDRRGPVPHTIGGGGVNFLMQLQFLAPVELFFKQLKGYSF